MSGDRVVRMVDDADSVADDVEGVVLRGQTVPFQSLLEQLATRGARGGQDCLVLSPLHHRLPEQLDHPRGTGTVHTKLP